MKQLLQAALREIDELRRDNQLLRAKVDTFERCFMMVQSLQPRSCGELSKPDICCEIQQKLRELSKVDEASDSTQSVTV